MEAQTAFVKRFALQVFHHKIKHAVGDLAEFTAANDVRMIELLKDMGFALKAFVDGLFEVSVAIDAEDLDGLVCVCVEIKCFVNGPKSALADQFDDTQRTDLHAQKRIFEQARPLCFGWRGNGTLHGLRFLFDQSKWPIFVIERTKVVRQKKTRHLRKQNTRRPWTKNARRPWVTTDRW